MVNHNRPTQPRSAPARRVFGMLPVAFALAVASGCSRGPAAPSPASSSLSVGRWIGTTSQGAAIAFNVSSNETLTTLSVGYDFNGCSGTLAFSGLSVSTVPNISCIPGPCPDTLLSGRSLNYSSGERGAGPITTVIGLFLPGGRAEGVVAFQDFPGCGTATSVEWTATRR